MARSQLDLPPPSILIDEHNERVRVRRFCTYVLLASMVLYAIFVSFAQVFGTAVLAFVSVMFLLMLHSALVSAARTHELVENVAARFTYLR